MVPTRPSRTAEAVALMRAVEQTRALPSRIVDDPYAPWFLSPLFRSQLLALAATGRVTDRRPLILPGLTTYVQARHRYMDDRLLHALEAGLIEQIVVLGAGYDMRAFRFAAAIGRRPVFEVDYPSTASRKARVLAARAADLSPVDVRRVSIDFQTQTLDAVLRGAGFVPGRPTFFLWEGVSMYLRRAAVQDTLRSLAALGGPGSELVMDYWSLLDTPDLRATAHRMSAGLLHFLSEPVTFALHPEDGPDFVRRLGWEAVEIRDSAALKAAYVQDDRGIYPAMWCLHARIRS